MSFSDFFLPTDLKAYSGLLNVINNDVQPGIFNSPQQLLWPCSKFGGKNQSLHSSMIWKLVEMQWAFTGIVNRQEVIIDLKKRNK